MSNRIRNIVLTVIAAIVGLGVLLSFVPDEAPSGTTNRDGVTLIPPATVTRPEPTTTTTAPAAVVPGRVSASDCLAFSERYNQLVTEATDVMSTADFSIPGMMDAIEDMLRAEIDAGRQYISACSYLDPSGAADMGRTLDALEDTL